MNDNVTQKTGEMSPTDERVAVLLGGLKRIEAPAGFDFRVRSAIANAKSAAKSGFGFRRVLLYAVPIAVIAAVGFPLAFYFAGRTAVRTAVNIPASAQVETARTSPVPEAITPPVADTGQTSAVNSIVPAGSVRETTSATKAATTSPKEAGRTTGGSYVVASREGKRILPKGLDPTARTPERPEEFSMNARITAKDVLLTLGINAKLDGSAWKIESVTENSTAARAGLKPGDIVRAINDQAVTGTTDFKGKVSGKSILIVRDGNEILVELPRR